MVSLAYLPYMRAFEAVARHGSVRGAGDELGLSPSAVSLQMRKLAEATGLKLIEKSGRGIRLTAAGREFSQTVRRSLAELQRGLQSAAQGLETDHRRKLRISVPPSLGVAWLAGAIVEHLERSDLPQVTVSTCRSAADVDWNGTDLAVVYDNPPFAGFWWQLLSEVRLRLVCSPLLLPRAELRRARQLRDVTLLHEDDGQEWSRWATASGVNIDGVRHAYFASVALALSCAVQGRGVALVSNVLAWAELQRGRLIQPLPAEIPASRAYYIVSPSDPRGDGTIATIVEFMTDFVRDVRKGARRSAKA